MLDASERGVAIRLSFKDFDFEGVFDRFEGDFDVFCRDLGILVDLLLIAVISKVSTNTFQIRPPMKLNIHSVATISR
jgi:hypothetical protein